MMGLSNAQRIYREKVATAKKRKEAALAVKRTSPSKYEKLFCKYCKSDDHLVGAFNKSTKSFVETCPVLLKNKAKKKNVKDEEKKKSAWSRRRLPPLRARPSFSSPWRAASRAPRSSAA